MSATDSSTSTNRHAHGASRSAAAFVDDVVVVAERRPQLDAASDDALLDGNDAERPQRIGRQLDVGGGRRDDEREH